MATELDQRCPICLDSWEEASHIMPCLHQFCYPCILRWVGRRLECPLCKRRIFSIVHSVRADDDYQEHVVTPPEEALAVGQPAQGAPGRAAGMQQLAQVVLVAPPGGLQPDTWASIFQEQPALLQPLQTWVRQELRRILRHRRSRAETVEAVLMSFLTLFGLHQDLMVQLLVAFLQDRTATFVHQIIEVAMQHGSAEARRLLGLEDGPAAGEREASPVPAPSRAASRGGSPTPGPAISGSHDESDEDDVASTSAPATVPGSPSSPPSVPLPMPSQQEEPQEEPEEVEAQPSTSSQGGERSPGGPRRPPKRTAGSDNASSPAKKKPPRRQD